MGEMDEGVHPQARDGDWQRIVNGPRCTHVQGETGPELRAGACYKSPWAAGPSLSPLRSNSATSDTYAMESWKPAGLQAECLASGFFLFHHHSIRPMLVWRQVCAGVDRKRQGPSTRGITSDRGDAADLRSRTGSMGSCRSRGWQCSRGAFLFWFFIYRTRPV